MSKSINKIKSWFFKKTNTVYKIKGTKFEQGKKEREKYISNLRTEKGT